MKKNKNPYFGERFPERYKKHKILSHDVLSKEVEDEFFNDLRLRVKDVRKELQLTQREFGESAGIDRRYVAKVECGSQHPSFKFMRSMSIKHKISMDWLMYNIGQRYLDTDEDAYGSHLALFKKLLDKGSPEDIDVVVKMIEKLVK